MLRYLFVFILTVALLFTACGNTENKETPTPDSVMEATATPTQETTPTLTPTATPTITVKPTLTPSPTPVPQRSEAPSLYLDKLKNHKDFWQGEHTEFTDKKEFEDYLLTDAQNELDAVKSALKNGKFINVYTVLRVFDNTTIAEYSSVDVRWSNIACKMPEELKSRWISFLDYGETESADTFVGLTAGTGAYCNMDYYGETENGEIYLIFSTDLHYDAEKSYVYYDVPLGNATNSTFHRGSAYIRKAVYGEDAEIIRAIYSEIFDEIFRQNDLTPTKSFYQNEVGKDFMPKN